MARPSPSSSFLEYLACQCSASPETNDSERIPSLTELSKELGVSVALLREQLEVAKALGLVEVRPRTGIRRLPYTFTPAVMQSLSYALSLDPANFEAFSQLRNHIEASFWDEAVRRLTPADVQALQELVAQAWTKLRGQPVQIPHDEHRRFHLGIFARLDNPFAQGILEAYWEAYEAVGLNVFADYTYLQAVWTFHQKMVDCIASGDFDGGHRALVEHTDLLYQRPPAAASPRARHFFE